MARGPLGIGGHHVGRQFVGPFAEPESARSDPPRGPACGARTAAAPRTAPPRRPHVDQLGDGLDHARLATVVLGSTAVGGRGQEPDLSSMSTRPGSTPTSSASSWPVRGGGPSRRPGPASRLALVDHPLDRRQGEVRRLQLRIRISRLSWETRRSSTARPGVRSGRGRRI